MIIKLTADRTCQIEEFLRQHESVHQVRDLPDFPFSGLEEIREAHRQGQLAFGATYTPRLLKTLGGRADMIAHYFWLWVPYFGVISFVVTAFLTGRWALVSGVFTTLLGVLLSSPYAQRVSKSIVGLAWIPLIYFVFTAPVAAWIVAGFYLGYIFTSTAREQFRMMVEEVALNSELVFCFLYLSKVLVVMDDRTGKLL